MWAKKAQWHFDASNYIIITGNAIGIIIELNWVLSIFTVRHYYRCGGLNPETDPDYC
jgi:hypothetical protein